MVRYHNFDVVFAEIPGETTLALNITGCPNRCPGCHSPHLQADEGRVLDEAELLGLLARYGRSVTCVAFMGGDAGPHKIARLAGTVRKTCPELRTAWYSGREELPEGFEAAAFDYVKLGGWVEDILQVDRTGMAVLMLLREIRNHFAHNVKQVMLKIFNIKGIDVMRALLNHDAACSMMRGQRTGAVFHAGRLNNFQDLLCHVVKRGDPPSGLELNFFLINFKFHIKSSDTILKFHRNLHSSRAALSITRFGNRVNIIFLFSMFKIFYCFIFVCNV